ncbi:unnamed protein product, partial [Didymodactylos carnosus]
LTGHTLLSPLDIFYPVRSTNIIQYHGRDRCLLFNMQDIEKFKKDIQERQAQFNQPEMRMQYVEKQCEGSLRAYYRREARGGDGEQKIAVRSNFNPLAHWIPSAITSSSGHATFEVKLPDNLTRYRVWALAANDKQYGLGETLFTVQLPVMVRPSPPRFLN